MKEIKDTKYLKIHTVSIGMHISVAVTPAKAPAINLS